MANERKILILDIGNSKTKCYVFGIKSESEVVEVHAEVKSTNRGHPWDLVDTCRNMILSATKTHQPQYGMITAFGDAFVYYDPENNSRPRFVFADEAVETPKINSYGRYGFPTGNISITGVTSLRKKHGAEWKNIVPVNIAIGAALCNEDDFRSWDFTQASASGDFNFFDRTELLTCKPYDWIGHFSGMPILAGGLDNAFLDTIEQTPYIVAGTWLVVSAIRETFDPTADRRRGGVRWLLSGEGRYLAQTVRRSQRPLTDGVAQRIIDDLELMMDSDEIPRQIRVFGAYSKELFQKLKENQCDRFDFHFKSYGEQHRSAAIYVARKMGIFNEGYTNELTSSPDA